MTMPSATTAIDAGTGRKSRFWPLLRQSLNAHGIFFAVIAIYYAGFLILLQARPDLEPSNFLLMAIGFCAFSLPVMLIGLLFTRFYHIATVVKPERPIPALLHDLKSYLTDRRRLAQGLPMVLIMVLFMYVFVELKSNIPRLNPYSWDPTFVAWDAALHFGRQPWEWLQPVFGHALITFLINLNYNAWFAVMWVVWVYFAFSDQTSETRTRFFLTFFVTWIIGGGLLAILFSSVGPCFYGLMGYAPDPFAPQMAYLREVNEIYPLWAVRVQDILWAGYQGQSTIDGISAMPSMHNGTALLFALAGFRVSRPIGWALSLHAAFIFIGSIHLAWHYAVDSYLAWAVTLVLWFGLAPVTRWWHGRSAQRSFDAAMNAA